MSNLHLDRHEQEVIEDNPRTRGEVRQFLNVPSFTINYFNDEFIEDVESCQIAESGDPFLLTQSVYNG